MATSSARAENIISRVEDFLKQEKEESALDLIFSFLMTKKKHRNWSQALEKIMLYSVDLGLKFERHNQLKKSLSVFRTWAQKHHSESLRIVLEHYLFTAENSFMNVSSSSQTREKFFEEGENEAGGADFYFNLLNFEEGEKKEKIKRAWRSLIGAYRHVLKLVYKNETLEQMYSDFAIRAFEKCSEFKALKDFKELCKTLRTQLKFVMKQKNEKKVSVRLWRPETNALMLDMRHQILDLAWELGLLQESFSILEELNQIMGRATKVMLNTLMKYYDRLVKVFLKGDFIFFHAVALQDYFACLCRRNTPSEELQQIADQLVLALLSVGRNSEELNLSEELKAKYCVMFAGRGSIPSLSDSLEALSTSRSLKVCSEPVRQLYRLRMGKYDVYEFASVFEKQMNLIGSAAKDYSDGIRANCVGVILQLISEFFENLSFEDLQEFTSFESFEAVQKEILLLKYQGELDLYLNFEEQLLEFNTGVSSRQIANEAMDDLILKLEQVKEIGRQGTEGQISNLRKLKNNYTQSFLDSEEQINEIKQHIKKQEEMRIKIRKSDRKGIVRDEEAERKERLQREKEEGRKKLDIKILNLKKEKINEILKINSKTTLLNIPLNKLKNHEIMQLDYDVFNTIQEDLEKESTLKANDDLKKKFKVFDFSIRRVLQRNWKDSLKVIKREELNLEEIKLKNAETQTKREQLRKELTQGQNFIQKYRKKKMKDREKELEQRKQDFIEKLNEKYADDIYDKALKSLNKKEEEAAKMQIINARSGMNNRVRRGENFTENREGPAPLTRLEGRGINFVAPNPNQTQTFGLAKRGENFKGTTTQNNDFKNQMMKNTDWMKNVNSKPILSRGGNFSNSAFGARKFTNKKLNTKPTEGMAKRGANLKPNMTTKNPNTGTITRPGMNLQRKGFGLNKPNPTMPQRGFGSDKPNPTMPQRSGGFGGLTRGQGMQRPKMQRGNLTEQGKKTFNNRKQMETNKKEQEKKKTNKVKTLGRRGFG